MSIIITSREEEFVPEEQKKIRERLVSLHQRYSDYLFENPDLKKEEVIEFGDNIARITTSAIRAGVEFRGLDELLKVMKIILDVSKECDETIEAFENETIRLKIEEAKKEKKFDYIKNLSPYEAYLKLHQILVRDITLNEIKTQFANTDLDLTFDDIEVTGKPTDGFNVLVKLTDSPEVFFQIFPNEGKFEDITNDLIGSSLKIGSLQIQTSPETYSKQGNNNFKSAQTIDKIIKRQIRLLKIIIKEEVETLVNSTGKAIERFETVKKIVDNFYPFLNKKTKEQLLNIMNETEAIVSKLLEKQKANEINTNNVDISKIKFSTKTEQIIKEDAAKLINIYESQTEIIQKIIDNINEIFITNKDKNDLKIELDENTLSIQCQIDKLNLNLKINSENIVSISITDSNKEIYEQFNIFGKDLEERIKNSILFVYSIFIKNEINLIFANVKKKKNIDLHKDINNSLDEISKVITAFSTDISEKIKIIINNIVILFNFLIDVEENFVIDSLEVIDKILQKIHKEIEGINGLKLGYDKENSVLSFFKYLKSETTDIFEIFNELKKYIEMNLTSNILIQVLNFYKKEQFNEETRLYSNEDRSLRLIGLEKIVKDLANILSENIMVGSCARKVLLIMDRSIILRDDTFKKDLENIISELIKARKEFYHI